MIARTVRGVAALLPADRPRYLMGVGRPEDLVEAVAAGVDLFDCVMPTRHARNGQMFVERGRVNVKRAEFRDDPGPLDPDRPFPAVAGYSRAYVHHLYRSGEGLAGRVMTLQNLSYYLDLMARMRDAIERGAFARFREEFYRVRGAAVPA